MLPLPLLQLEYRVLEVISVHRVLENPKRQVLVSILKSIIWFVGDIA